MTAELDILFQEHGLHDEYLHVIACSPYATSVFALQLEQLSSQLALGQWQVINSISEDNFLRYLDSDTFFELTELQFKAVLRQFRNFYSAYIIWHDLNGNLDWRKLFHLQSDLADVCMQLALAYVEAQSAKQYQTPIDADGKPLQLCVVAMGKWGGQELNFSSDIDYLYVYAEKGEVKKLVGMRTLSHQEYFTKQAQKINQLLDDVTADGFVYRCDTRLRPFGDSGPLVVPLSALEQYLLEHGREWERYAYLKARCVSGDDVVKSEFEELRRPFVYRRYLDYGVFANLREMHAQISSQVQKKQIKDDIKLGRGGIRECEFLVQSYQLIRGGREPELQQANFHAAYTQLRQNSILADEDESFLQAYVFHRLLENRLQALHQKQTHQLPGSKQDHAALVKAMGADQWHSLLQEWEQHRQVVATSFEHQARLFKFAHDADELSYVVLLDEQLQHLQSHFSQAGIEPSLHAHNFKQSHFYKHLHDQAKRLIDQLLFSYFKYLNDQIIAGHIEVTAAEDIDRRFLGVLTAIGRRQTYFSLLIEHPEALHNLVAICAKSGFISEQVAEHPILLDELLDARIFKQYPTMQSVRTEVMSLSDQLQDGDVESYVQKLLRVKNVQVFRIALADVSGQLSLMKVSDCLTVLADSLLSLVLDFVSIQTTQKLKVPVLDWRTAGFTVIAYGKLGGLELSYSSDLDIVFLFDEQQVPAEHPLAQDRSMLRKYYHRLAQQCIRILDMPTISGRLYEVDTRLRPSGKSGFLVSSFAGFEKYQQQEAWVWEHQALLRARALLGSSRSVQYFELLRKQILVDSVKHETLRAEVISMRNKMRQELDKLADKTMFHLKHSQGGMVDVEFLVQYLVLAHAQQYPELLKYSDNVRQLEAVAAVSMGVTALPGRSEVKQLTRIYLNLRARAHALALEQLAAVVSLAEVKVDSQIVIDLWKKYLLDDT